MNQYRKSEWRSFRDEIIELDGRACVVCSRTEDNGIVLQVHHKEYISGKLPWKYPYNLCETLCKGCHAAEHGIIPPKNGWEYGGDDDLGDLCGTCELCGSAIRYVFYVSHENWPTMEVGTVCCDNLTGTETASALRRKEDRRAKFINSPRWKESGGELHIRQKKIDVIVFSCGAGYRLRMNGVSGKSKYLTAEEAKAKVFEFIDSGEAEDFFRIRSYTKR
ncbi:HNH endonuclease [Microbulbifer sp. SSSA008]|uniref:HNH endonuclease n=1 Tax=Microbulbifer sp. SSSA008 TaxID=3243380 RepID=UPI00403A5ECB